MYMYVHVSRSIRANAFGKLRPNLGQKNVNVVCCILVTDDIKKIGKGLLYVHTEFDNFSTILHGEIWNSNPLG